MFSPTLRAVASILSSAVRSTSGLYLSSSVCIAENKVSGVRSKQTTHNLVFPLRAHKRHNVLHVTAECLVLAGSDVSLEQSSEVGRNVFVPLCSWRDALEKGGVRPHRAPSQSNPCSPLWQLLWPRCGTVEQCFGQSCQSNVKANSVVGPCIVHPPSIVPPCPNSRPFQALFPNMFKAPTPAPRTSKAPSD